jgi:hypothetical protein
MFRTLIASTVIGAIATFPLAAVAAGTDTATPPAAGPAGASDVQIKTGVMPAPGVNTTTGSRSSVDATGLLAPGAMVASNVVGAKVIDGAGDNIGEIGDLVIANTGQVNAYVIDVGGFLGIGEKHVALQSTDVTIVADADGNLKINTMLTKDQLKALPDFKVKPDDAKKS